MERSNDAVLEVTCKDETAVVGKLFNESPKSWLSRVWIQVIRFV
jgi:hypothetical protein